MNNYFPPLLLHCWTLSQRSLRLCFSNVFLSASFQIVCIALSLSSVNFHFVISDLLLSPFTEFFSIIPFNPVSSIFFYFKGFNGSRLYMQKFPITFILGSFLFLTFSPHYVDIFFYKYICKIFTTWLHQVLVLALRIFTLHCSIWDLQTKHGGSFFFFPSVVACGIQFLDQGWNPGTLHWEHGVLTTAQPRKSLFHTFDTYHGCFKAHVCQLHHMGYFWLCYVD